MNFSASPTYDIWKTDDTAAGTKLVKNMGEFKPRFSGYYSTSQMYFIANKDDGNGETPDTYQLWKINDTATGINLVKDLGNWQSYDIFNMINDWNEKTYFVSAKYNTTTKTNNYELWSTDGTTTGTKLVKSLGLNQPEYINGWLDTKNLYFRTVKDDANDSTPDNYQLWKTNGTATGTTLVKDLGKWDYYGGNVSNWNGKTYFTSAKYNTTTKINNYELWSTDGTTTGTKLVKSLGLNQPDYINGWLDDKNLYFTTVKDDGNWETPDTYQLWKTNGTATGTSLVKDLGKWDYYYNIDNWNGKTYFTSAKYNTTTKTNNYELWSTDGTTTGTKLVKSLGLNQPDNIYSWFEGNNLYFTTKKDDGNYETPDSFKLWKTNGTATGTTLVKDLGKWDYYGWDISNWNGKTYFTSAKYNTTTKTNNYELWSTDGTINGTKFMKSFGEYEPKEQTGLTYYYDNSVDRVFITVKDDGDYSTPDPSQLWKTDGTSTGTQLLQNLGKQERHYNYIPDGSTGNGYYYQAITGTNGNELWKLPYIAPTTTTRSAIESNRESNYDPLLQGGLAEKIISLADQSDVVLPPELQPNHLHNLLGKAMNNLSSGDFNNQMALDELRTKLSQVQELLPLNLQDSLF